MQAANPIEKLILYRLLKLLRLNIQFLFVFDGANRPRGKRGKHGGGGILWKEITPLKNLLKQLGVAQHIAPGEAEAECAALQRHGFVDAVWSEDCDCLMFGCNTLIRDFREGGKKSETKVRIYRAETLKQKLGLDREGLVAFATLNGGDYDTTGLKGCGPKLAIRAARRGLGKTLCDAIETGTGMGFWRSELVDFLREQRNHLEVPHNYPSADKVRLYFKPLVSRPHELANLNFLRIGWALDVDEAKLREHLRDHYNFFTKEYIKHIVPVLLARSFVQANPEKQAFIGRCDMQPAKRSKKETEEAAESSRKISFKAIEVTRIDIGESVAKDLTMERQKKGPPFDPDEKTECEFLDVVLRHVFPHRDFSASSVQKRKSTKKTQHTGLSPDASPQKLKRKRKSSEANFSGDLDGPFEAGIVIDQPKKRQRGKPKTYGGSSRVTTSSNESTLQDLDTDQILRELTPSFDLPDLDSILRKPCALAPLSPNISRKMSNAHPEVETAIESRLTRPSMFSPAKKGFGIPTRNIIGLTDD